MNERQQNQSLLTLVHYVFYFYTFEKFSWYLADFQEDWWKPLFRLQPVAAQQMSRILWCWLHRLVSSEELAFRCLLHRWYYHLWEKLKLSSRIYIFYWYLIVQFFVFYDTYTFRDTNATFSSGWWLCTIGTATST